MSLIDCLHHFIYIYHHHLTFLLFSFILKYNTASYFHLQTWSHIWSRTCKSLKKCDVYHCVCEYGSVRSSATFDYLMLMRLAYGNEACYLWGGTWRRGMESPDRDSKLDLAAENIASSPPHAAACGWLSRFWCVEESIAYGQFMMNDDWFMITRRAAYSVRDVCVLRD